MKKILSLMILMSLLNVTVYSQIKVAVSDSVNNSLEWNNYTKNNFAIKYPQNWSIDTSQQMGMSFILFSKLSGESDQFKENVNLLIQDLSSYELSLDQYVEISAGQIKTMLTDGQIIVSERRKGPRYAYQKMIYTGKQGIFDLKFEQYYWLIGKKAFVLTLTTEKSEFDAYQKIGEAILNSFKVKEI